MWHFAIGRPAGSTTVVKHKSFNVQSACSSIIKWSLLQWNGCDFHVSTHDTIRPRLPVLSHDNILKFDWYCQLSGSRSNSMNLRKLPGSSADSYTFLTAIASLTTQRMKYSHLLLTMPIALSISVHTRYGQWVLPAVVRFRSAIIINQLWKP